MKGLKVAGTALTAVLASCVSEAPQAGQNGPAELALRLTLPAGEQIDSVSYSVSGGPNAITRSGNIDVQSSSVLRFRVGDLPVGGGYVINLSAVTSAGATCAGSSPFAIVDNNVTTLDMSMTCDGSSNESDTSGDLRVNGTVVVVPGRSCPVVSGISTLPAQGSVALAIEGFATSAPDSVSWSAPSGTFANAGTAATNFVCAGAGEVTLTFSIQKADCPAASATAQVTCEAPDARGLIWNEIESNGGTPDDWVELYNTGSQPVDLTGWTFRDNDNTHIYAIPSGTIVAPGGYLILENFGFGLGSPDEARLFNASGQLVLSYGWTPHAQTTYGRCPNVTGALTTTSVSTKGTANDCTPVLRINEIESNGGVPGDWVELYNPSSSSVDMSGWIFRDNNDAAGYTLPAGSIIAAGGYLMLEEASFGFGLGGGDAARLFKGTTLVDSYVWTAHAGTTYGRCPNGSGDFAATASITKGAANDCGGSVVSPWLGGTSVTAVDPLNSYPSNLSGLHYQPANGSAPAALWAALNGPGKLYRLVQSGTQWIADGTGWATGKLLHYPDGTGEPDSEGVTKAEWSATGIYVSTERNNQASGVSRLSVLRFDETSSASELNASHEWNLTSQLPAVGANAGLEAIAWIPDSYLVARGFRDARLGKLYTPADYANHGAGLFAVGVEGTGNVHVLALDHTSSAAFVLATFSGQLASVMDLEFDRDQGLLFVVCDDTCANQMTLFTIDQTSGSPTLGQFVLRKRLAPPSGLAIGNHEGFTFQSSAECVNGEKAAFWCDDSNSGGNALRQGTISCAPQF